MKRSLGRVFLRSVGFGICFVLILGTPLTWGGSLRLKMTDGTSVEVPYYWEEGGEVKFEIPGGVAVVDHKNPFRPLSGLLSELLDELIEFCQRLPQLRIFGFQLLKSLF